MKRRLVALLTACALVIGVVAPAAGADPSCTGSLADRPSSCFNAGPSDVGFHGPK